MDLFPVVLFLMLLFFMVLFHVVLFVVTYLEQDEDHDSARGGDVRELNVE